jgi:phosphoglycerate dehydrogenase-like enzyme
MPRVLYADHDYSDIDLERRLFADAGIDLVAAQCRTEAEVVEAAAGCAGILSQYAPVGEIVVAALPQLGVVSRIGVGYDNIDTAACARHGVWVANSPDYGIGEVATHALALALALIRNVVAYHRDIHAGQWHHLSAGKMQRPAEMTLGIVGLGRIGKRMAHVSRNVFKRVVAFDPHLIDGDFPPYVERVAELGALFEASDIVSIHAPLNAETRGVIDAGVLQRMRSGSYLVNTARGAIVRVDDLLAALDGGILAGAGLDVLPAEPIAAGDPLLGHPKVILTPHAAFFSVQSEIDLRRKAAQNIVSWLATGRPDYIVVPGTRRPR